MEVSRSFLFPAVSQQFQEPHAAIDRCHNGVLVRYPVSELKSTLRSVAVIVCVLFLAACGGSSIGPGASMCNTGTVQQLANPVQNQSGVSATIGQITIVAFSNNNLLYNTYAQWVIQLVDNTGTVWNGQSLQLVADPSGPHPYTSDFYYSSNIPQLVAGRTYGVRLSQSGNACRAQNLGSFST